MKKILFLLLLASCTAEKSFDETHLSGKTIDRIEIDYYGEVNKPMYEMLITTQLEEDCEFQLFRCCWEVSESEIAKFPKYFSEHHMEFDEESPYSVRYTTSDGNQINFYATKTATKSFFEKVLSDHNGIMSYDIQKCVQFAIARL